MRSEHAGWAQRTVPGPKPPSLLSPTEYPTSQTVELLPILGAHGLFERWEQVVDPRKRRGVRHPLQSILSIAACAVLSGAVSICAIGEWAMHLSAEQLRRFGSRRSNPPSERTLRRMLGALDAAAFDRIVGQWAKEHCESVGRFGH